MNKYLCDNEPVSANDLIRLASDYDDDFAGDWLKQTSVAAQILREHGHTIENNPDFND